MPKKRNNTNIKKRKKLNELYARGVEIRFDGNGSRKGPFEDPLGEEEVAIWVQPPNPLQREMAMREAAAERARAILSVKKDTGSNEALEAEAYVAQMELSDLIEYVLDFDEGQRQRQAIRDVLEKDEWEDFTDLQDAVRRWEEAGSPEDDEEWEPLLERDKEYGRQVAERREELRDAARQSLGLMHRGDLEQKALKKRVDLAGSQAFVSEYEHQMLYFACRDDEDHEALFFEYPEEVREYPEEVRNALAEVLAEFITESEEAKNSQRAASGSESSEPPEEPETSEVSTPETVNA